MAVSSSKVPHIAVGGSIMEEYCYKTTRARAQECTQDCAVIYMHCDTKCHFL